MIGVDTTELQSLIKSFQTFGSTVLSENLKQGAQIAGDQVKTEARQLVAVDTGALRLSISNTVSMIENGVRAEVGPDKSYGKEIEFGRPAGTFVSAEALKGWARRKGLNPYVISKKIWDKGSPAQPFLYPAFLNKEQTIVKIIGQAVTNAVNKVFS